MAADTNHLLPNDEQSPAESGDGAVTSGAEPLELFQP